MNILSFETSHVKASVALLTDAGLYEKDIYSDLKHEQTVMPAVVSLLEDHRIDISKLDYVSVDIGPGSFTGIRIGICHANAISDAIGIPCIGICALDAMAHNVTHSDDAFSVMIDAGNGNCYGAIYDKDHRCIYGPVAEETNTFRQNTIRLGCSSESINQTNTLPTAGTIASLARSRAESISDKHSRALPLYLRKSQAERKRNL